MTAQLALHVPGSIDPSRSADGARPASRARPASSVGPAAGTARLRLTRRGRLVLIGLPLMLTAAALLFAAGFFAAPAAASGNEGAPAESLAGVVAVTVGPGESLWSLALEFAPEQDPRVAVAQIADLNGLGGALITEGQQLFVPASR